MDVNVPATRELLAEVFQRSPSFTAVMSGPDHVFEVANAAYLQLALDLGGTLDRLYNAGEFGKQSIA